MFSDLLIKASRYRLPLVWCIIRRHTRCDFDDIATKSAWSFEKTEKLIPRRLRMHYLEVTKFPRFPPDELRKKAVFKLIIWSAGFIKCFQISYNGKAMLGDSENIGICIE